MGVPPTTNSKVNSFVLDAQISPDESILTRIKCSNSCDQNQFSVERTLLRLPIVSAHPPNCVNRQTIRYNVEHDSKHNICASTYNKTGASSALCTPMLVLLGAWKFHPFDILRQEFHFVIEYD